MAEYTCAGANIEHASGDVNESFSKKKIVEKELKWVCKQWEKGSCKESSLRLEIKAAKVSVKNFDVEEFVFEMEVEV